MKYFFLAFAFSFILSCSKKGAETFNLKKDYLEFGNGGGFTGAFNSVYLTPKGEVYRKASSDTTFMKIGTIDINKAKQQFSSFNNLGLSKMNLNEPGNRYFYIVSNTNGVEHKIQWGKNELTNKTPEILHKVMMDLVKKIESTKK